MKERDERRVLGAIRWVDAVTQARIERSLTVRSSTAAFTRNLGGLCVITSVQGLEKLAATFDPTTLLPAEGVANGTVQVVGQVSDPDSTYLPRAFTINLPLDATAALPAPANSLFQPVDVQLLPTPAARVMAGWAQVRVAVTKKADDSPAPNVLVRVVKTADQSVLGRGMSDARGEALVAIPSLPLFQAGATADAVLTSQTTARLEFVPPPSSDAVLDWTKSDVTTATAANISPTLLALQAGGTYSTKFAVTT